MELVHLYPLDFELKSRASLDSLPPLELALVQFHPDTTPSITHQARRMWHQKRLRAPQAELDAFSSAPSLPSDSAPRGIGSVDQQVDRWRRDQEGYQQRHAPSPGQPQTQDFDVLLGILSAEARTGNSQPLAREIQHQWCRRTEEDSQHFLDHVSAAQEAGLIERWVDRQTGDWMELATEGPPRPPPVLAPAPQPVSPSNFHLADLDFALSPNLNLLTSVQLLSLQFRDDFPSNEVVDSKTGLTGVELVEEIWFKRATRDRRHGQAWKESLTDPPAHSVRRSPRPLQTPNTPPYSARGRSDSLSKQDLPSASPQYHQLSPPRATHLTSRDGDDGWDDSARRVPVPPLAPHSTGGRHYPPSFYGHRTGDKKVLENEKSSKSDHGSRHESKRDRADDTPRKDKRSHRKSSSNSSADEYYSSRHDKRRDSTGRHYSSRSRRRSASPPFRHSHISASPPPRFAPQQPLLPDEPSTSFNQDASSIDPSQPLPEQLVNSFSQIEVKFGAGLPYELKFPTALHELYVERFSAVAWHVENPGSQDPVHRVLFPSKREAGAALDWFGLAGAYWRSNHINASLFRSRDSDGSWKAWSWDEVSEFFRRSYGIDVGSVDPQRVGVEGRGWKKFDFELRREARKAAEASHPSSSRGTAGAAGRWLHDQVPLWKTPAGREERDVPHEDYPVLPYDQSSPMEEGQLSEGTPAADSPRPSTYQDSPSVPQSASSDQTLRRSFADRFAPTFVPVDNSLDSSLEADSSPGNSAQSEGTAEGGAGAGEGAGTKP